MWEIYTGKVMIGDGVPNIDRADSGLYMRMVDGSWGMYRYFDEIFIEVNTPARYMFHDLDWGRIYSVTPRSMEVYCDSGEFMHCMTQTIYCVNSGKVVDIRPIVSFHDEPYYTWRDACRFIVGIGVSVSILWISMKVPSFLVWPS